MLPPTSACAAVARLSSVVVTAAVPLDGCAVAVVVALLTAAAVAAGPVEMATSARTCSPVIVGVCCASAGAAARRARMPIRILIMASSLMSEQRERDVVPDHGALHVSHQHVGGDARVVERRDQRVDELSELPAGHR